MDMLKNLSDKAKWYLVIAIAAVAMGILIVFNLHESYSKDLVRWMFNKKKAITVSKINRSKEKSDAIHADIHKAEAKVEELDHRINVVKEDVDKMDLSELDDAWKNLGY